MSPQQWAQDQFLAENWDPTAVQSDWREKKNSAGMNRRENKDAGREFSEDIPSSPGVPEDKQGDIVIQSKNGKGAKMQVLVLSFDANWLLKILSPGWFGNQSTFRWETELHELLEDDGP